MRSLLRNVALAAALGLAAGVAPVLVAPAPAAAQEDDQPITAEDAKRGLDEALGEGAYPEADGKLARQLLEKMLAAKVAPEAGLEIVFVALETRIVDHVAKLVAAETQKGTQGKALEDKVRTDGTFKAKYAELGGE